MNVTGKIFKGIAGFYYIHTPEGDFACKAKGIFRNRGMKPLVGDDVEIEIIDRNEMTGSIVKILPRRNALIRPEVANVDQAVVVFALTNPAPNLNLLDRFLISMEQRELPVVIFFNKNDLVDAEGTETAVMEVYRAAGYEVHALSTKAGDYRDEIMQVLRGRTTVLAGPSGVGKSSITNMIHPEAQMETGELSRKIERGKHTTRHSEFFYLDDDTYVLDTPGFTSLFVTDIKPENLMYYFREFEEHRDACKFHTCVHIGERDCGVKRALEEGRIAQTRYESYLQIYDELKSSRRY